MTCEGGGGVGWGGVCGWGLIPLGKFDRLTVDRPSVSLLIGIDSILRPRLCFLSLKSFHRSRYRGPSGVYAKHTHIEVFHVGVLLPTGYSGADPGILEGGGGRVLEKVGHRNFQIDKQKTNL